MVIKMTHAEKLKKLNSVMPQAAIAEKLSRTQSFVSQIVNGQRKRIDYDVGVAINALYDAEFVELKPNKSA